MTQKECKQMLGKGYRYVENDIKSIKQVLAHGYEHYAGQAAIYLTAGCVKLEVVFSLTDGTLTLRYECSVKESAEHTEWIVYDSLPDQVDLDAPDMEQEMFSVLERYVTEHELSYTECNWKTLKPEKENKQDE